jgi:hypothetical protein
LTEKEGKNVFFLEAAAQKLVQRKQKCARSHTERFAAQPHEKVRGATPKKAFKTEKLKKAKVFHQEEARPAHEKKRPWKKSAAKPQKTVRKKQIKGPQHGNPLLKKPAV